MVVCKAANLRASTAVRAIDDKSRGRVTTLSKCDQCWVLRLMARPKESIDRFQVKRKVSAFRSILRRRRGYTACLLLRPCLHGSEFGV